MSAEVARGRVVFGPGSLALLVTLWLAWGLSYPVIGFAMTAVDPLSLRVVVMGSAGAILLLHAALTGGRMTVPRRLWRDVAISAFGNMTLCQMGLTLGIYWLGGGRSSVLMYTMPLWAALLGRLLLGEPITARRGVALALGAAAVLVLFAQKLPDARDAPLGVLANLVAALGFAFGTVWTKRTLWPLDLGALVGWQLLVGTLPLAAGWLIARPPLELPDVAHWLAFAYMVLIGNVLAYLAWFRLVDRLPTVVVGIGSLVVPCLGVLSSALLMDEAVRLADLLALALVCGALGLVLFLPRRTATSA